MGFPKKIDAHMHQINTAGRIRLIFSLCVYFMFIPVPSVGAFADAVDKQIAGYKENNAFPWTPKVARDGEIS